MRLRQHQQPNKPGIPGWEESKRRQVLPLCLQGDKILADHSRIRQDSGSQNSKLNLRQTVL